LSARDFNNEREKHAIFTELFITELNNTIYLGAVANINTIKELYLINTLNNKVEYFYRTENRIIGFEDHSIFEWDNDTADNELFKYEISF